MIKQQGRIMEEITSFKIIDMGDKSTVELENFIAEVKTRHIYIGEKLIDKSNMGFFKKMLTPFSESYPVDKSYTVKAYKNNGRWVWETGVDAPELLNHEIVYWGKLRLKELEDKKS